MTSLKFKARLSLSLGQSIRQEKKNKNQFLFGLFSGVCVWVLLEARLFLLLHLLLLREIWILWLQSSRWWMGKARKHCAAQKYVVYQLFFMAGHQGQILRGQRLEQKMKWVRRKDIEIHEDQALVTRHAAGLGSQIACFGHYSYLQGTDIYFTMFSREQKDTILASPQPRHALSSSSWCFSSPYHDGNYIVIWIIIFNYVFPEVLLSLGSSIYFSLFPHKADM